MTALRDGGHRALEACGQLFAQQHEHDAVQGELHGVPHCGPLHARGRQQAAAELDVAHRDARRRQDAGGLGALGQQVRAEGNQQADQGR